MKNGLKIMIATLAVSTLLAACGSKGGDGGGATNAAPAAAPAWTSSFPAGFVGSGTYQGQIATIQSSIGAFYQMAGMLSSCGVGGGIGFGQSSFLNIRVVLGSNTGGYVGQAGTAVGASVGGFALSGGASVFSRNMVYTTGSPAGFTLATGICNRYNNAAPPAAGEPSISINGQFQDQTMTVMNVQVIFTSAQTGAVQIAGGQIFGNPTGGYGQPGYGYGQQQPGYGYGYGYGGGAYTVPAGGAGGYYYYSTRR